MPDPERPDYNSSQFVLVHYEAEICKQISEAGGDEWCIVKKYMHGIASHLRGNALVTS